LCAFIAVSFHRHHQFVADSKVSLPTGARSAYIGVACAILGSIAFSAKTILVKLGSMRYTAYASISASVFVIAHFMALHGPARLAVAHEVYVVTIIMALFSTVLPLWLIAEGLRRIGPNQVALVGCIRPLSTMVFGQIFLGEHITPIQLMGAGLGPVNN